VAGTRRGFCTFRLADLLRVPDDAGIDVAGYRYVLPLRFGYDAVTADGHEHLRYSFLSLDRRDEGARMVAGEYGRRGATTRLVDFSVDPSTLLLDVTDDGVAHPRSMSGSGVEGMQGAVVVDGRWYVTSSAGRYLRGSMHVGRPGAFRRRARVLPAGVEDLSYWPSRDELWSLTEYPGRRWVFAMDRARFG